MSLDSAIGERNFLIASVISVIGLIVVLFLREDPLRTSHLTFEQGEMLAAEAEAGATGSFTPEAPWGTAGGIPRASAVGQARNLNRLPDRSGEASRRGVMSWATKHHGRLIVPLAAGSRSS
ncbi:MAG: hypothetical protein R2826_02215 [Thermoleophilia bacterium]